MNFVNHQHIPSAVTFESLPEQSTFIHEHAVRDSRTAVFAVLKPDAHSTDGYNAICLNDMERCSFSPESKVIQVSCDLHWSVK